MPFPAADFQTRPLSHPFLRLARAPGLTAAVVLMLAAGIGVGVSMLGMIRGGLARSAACIDPVLCGPELLPDHLPRWTEARQLLPEVQAEGLRTLLFIGLGLSLLVLGIVVVNILTFVLTRSAARRAETAMRATLGAAPWPLAGRSAAEGAVLVLSGSALGITAGAAGSLLLRRSWPFEDAPWGAAPVRGEVFALVVGVLASVALIAWLSPVRVAWSRSLQRYLGSGSRATAGPTEVWLRQGLAVAQVSATLILLASAGLLLRSFVTAGEAGRGPGFDPRNTLTAQVEPPAEAGTAVDQRAQYYEELLRRVRLAPGVLDSSVATNGAWAGVGPTDRVTALCPECRIGTLPLQLSRGPARLHSVSPGFFAALGLRVVSGREFAGEDRAGSAPVAVVNKAFAIELLPNGEPLGKEVQLGGSGGDWYRIVGVVADVTAEGLGSGATPTPTLYLSLLQHPPRTAALAVRSAGDPMELRPVVEAIAATLQPGSRLTNAITMERFLERYRAPLGWFAIVFGALAAAVVILATFGLYGVISHHVVRRRREIGIRMALGAESRRVVRMVLGETVRLAALGVVLGLIPLSGLARLLQVMFRGVELWEPTLYIGIAGLITAVALVASYPPAHGAALVDPQVTLREE